jgi:putative transcriptional regulator
MINHHPEEELMLALAAGRLDAAQALLVSVHLESCTTCRGRLHTLQALGGALLDAAEPKALAANALQEVLARVESTKPAADGAARSGSVPLLRPALPDGVPWPRSLGRCAVSRWSWMGPGMRWSRVALPHPAPGGLFLLRIAPGRSLARHTHSGIEHTQVLCGAFHDGRSLFASGDFDTADDDVHHQPVVQAGGECVCLAYVGGQLEFDGWLAGMIGRTIGM